MKITAVEPVVVPGRASYMDYIFVLVHTDEGITGHGDATNYPGSLSVAKSVAELADVVIGQDPFDIEKIWNQCYRYLYYVGTAGVAISAISGVETALWDIVGKALRSPVYNLLGGRCQDPLPLYTHPRFTGRPQDTVDSVREIMEAGFRTVKLDPYTRVDGNPFMEPKLNRSMNRDEIRRGARVVEAIRKELGSAVDIAIDLHGRWDVPTAIAIGQELQQYDLLFLEEPVPPENHLALRQVRESVQCRIMTGERLYTRHGFRAVLESQAADMIMPDVVRTGGILETKKVAAMAETYYVPVAPHNPNSPLSSLLTAHLCTTLPNFLILETIFGPYDAGYRDELMTEPLPIRDGHFHLPRNPGYGIDLNLEALAKYRRTSW